MQSTVEIESRGLTLRGMLHIPDGFIGKIPLVVIFHGFAGNKMANHYMFVKLSRRLEKEGIASIRFDFGGSGESDGNFIDMTLSGELEDARRILAYVKSLDFVDKDRISLTGLSMGGAVASLLAGEKREEIHSICLWAPAGNMGEVVARYYIGGRARELELQGYLDVAGFSMGKAFVDEVTALDIYRKAAHFNRKVLLIHGDDDQVVPLSASEKYQEVYGANARLIVIKKGDHTFDKKEWEDEVLEHTAEYFRRGLLTGRAAEAENQNLKRLFRPLPRSAAI